MMDIVTGATIVGGIATVCGTALAAIKHVKKPDETWRNPFVTLEEGVKIMDVDVKTKLQGIDNRLIKVETHIEGISEIKKNIDKLEVKIDGLTKTIIDWIKREG
jgi:hypothetical protein